MALQETLPATITEVNSERWISVKFEWRGERYETKFQLAYRPITPYKLGEEINLVINEGRHDREPIIADINRLPRN